MPYSIRKSGGKYKIIKKKTGKTVGTSSNKNDAMKAIAARYAAESRKS
jgi:hypothetical protein